MVEQITRLKKKINNFFFFYNFKIFFFYRVLLERLVVNNPWGLLVTFIELIKNTQFKFWSHQFVHCAKLKSNY